MRQATRERHSMYSAHVHSIFARNRELHYYTYYVSNVATADCFTVYLVVGRDVERRLTLKSCGAEGSQRSFSVLQNGYLRFQGASANREARSIRYFIA